MKFLFFPVTVMLVFTANAQRTKEEVIGRLMTDQKKWHQSKMPVTVFYKNNYTYKVPMYNPGWNYLSNHSDQHVLAAVKTKLNFNYTIPLNNLTIMSFSDSLIKPWGMQYLKNKQLYK